MVPLNIWTVSFIASLVYILCKVIQYECFESPKEIEKEENKRYSVSQLSCATRAALNHVKKDTNNNRLTIIKIEELKVSHKIFSFKLQLYDFDMHVTRDYTFKVIRPMIEKKEYKVESYQEIKYMSDTDKTMLPMNAVSLTDVAGYSSVTDLRKM